LGPKEFACGLTYTAMSRVKDVNNLAFDDPMPTVDRFTSISRYKHVKQRKVEDERLKKLEETTFACLALISDEDDISQHCDEPSDQDNNEPCDLD
jgi:hypothetical protein